jgi:TM2 domain-containing membrane protein YozV
MYRIIGADGQSYGPVSAEQLKRWLAENRVNGLTQVLAEGATEWKPLGALPEFAAGIKATPPPLSDAARQQLAGRAAAKVPAGICGILLGSLGIHKFVLGYTGAGLVMLLVSVLTCFIAAPIFSVIGLIEGIIYLTKSDEEFVRTYVDGRREWF